MRVIISGSRSINDPRVLDMAIIDAGFEITEVVSGCAKGVDTEAIAWAEENNIPVEPFPADWSNLSHPDAIIKTQPWGEKYDARAGLRRNELMAVYADALIAIWDGKSPGTKHMIKMARKRGLPIYIYRTDASARSGHLQYETKHQFLSRMIKRANEAPDCLLFDQEQSG